MFKMVQEYNLENLECSPTRLKARNIDDDQSSRLQQGLDASAVPCNAYDTALKTYLHIDLDPINPDFDISPPGIAALQCERIPDCYAKELQEGGQPESLRTLAFESDGKFVASIGLPCMAQLQRRHAQLSDASLSEDVVALLKRYKHGNESGKYTVHLSGHWQLSPVLNDLLRAALPIAHERFAFPLDVQPDTQAYWTPFAADRVFGADHDCFSTAWRGCSQADPPRQEDMMDTTVRWAMASALTTQDPVLTIMNLSLQPRSACTKWLGHPLVHVMLKIQPWHNANWCASRVPADFWLEDESAYKARSQSISGAMLVILIANRQGAQEYLSSARLACMREGLLPMGGVEYNDPTGHAFPDGATPARQYARFTPRFRLPKAFPDIKASGSQASLPTD